MDQELWHLVITSTLAGMTSGLLTGFVCFVAMRQDVKWLKESVTELRTLFFKYVQENNHRGG